MSQALNKAEHNALLHRDAKNQHPISAIEGLEEALNGKVPTERKVNGQALDKDVEITEVKSAEKLKTARTINGVEFDGTYNIKVYGESELPKQPTTIYTAGWYRFAHAFSTAISGIIRIARNYGNGYPELYTLILNATYDDCEFTQLSSRFLHSQYISKIRAVYKQGDFYLDFYYSSDVPNTVTTKVSDIMPSFNTDTFSNVSYEIGSIPEGYSVKEFDLSASPIKVSSLDIGNTTLTETQLQALLALLT